ncbi:MAG: uracil-DNA glycosylase [Gemmatimonadetes bacterium]|nr:uracil-DNA glycosylase [Gemmatimonadota bacterium]
MGETEFVLDSLHVDDVLRVLGAGNAGPDTIVAGPPAPVPAPTRQMPEPRPMRASGGEEHGNWRDALRAIGNDPTALTTPGGADRSGAAVSSPIAHGSSPTSDTKPGPTVPAPTDPPGAIASLGAGLSVGPPLGTLGSPSAWDSLDAIARAVAACTLCSLYAGAKNPVPGHGNPQADFVCVGEAPGANEDEQGVPFVGQAGQLLTKILAAINLSREDVFICNVLKHRPPGNRNPNPDEVTACSPYLVRQIELLRPKVILALGTFAAQTLLQTKEPLGKLRGRLHRYHGVPVIVTYHPAALLRNPSWKRPTWEDVQLARTLLDRVVEP